MLNLADFIIIFCDFINI